MEDLKRETEEEMKMLDDERELERERAYRRMEYWDTAAREEGVGGKKAAGIIPAAKNESGNSSRGGAVSGTDSESDAPTGKQVQDLTSVKWVPKLESELEDMLVRN